MAVGEDVPVRCQDHARAGASFLVPASGQLFPHRNTHDGRPHGLHHCNDGAGVNVEKFDVRFPCGAELTSSRRTLFVLLSVDQLQDLPDVFFHPAPPFFARKRNARDQPLIPFTRIQGFLLYDEHRNL
jgi:hypothetical protein